MSKTYIAVYERATDDDGWVARIDSVPGCRTHGRTIPQARDGIRYELRWRLGVEWESSVVEDRMPLAIAAVAKRTDRARREADRAVARAKVEVVHAARELAALGLSRRDSAAILGISHQRVQQLIRRS